MKKFWFLLFAVCWPPLWTLAQSVPEAPLPPITATGPSFHPRAEAKAGGSEKSDSGPLREKHGDDEEALPKQKLKQSISTAEQSHGPFFSIVEENDDLANNGDQHYTQGLRLSYTLGEEQTPRWAARLAEQLPQLGMKLEQPRFGVAVGQNIYTPKNMFTRDMVMNDRPYAGWLYLGAILQRRGVTARQTPVMDNFELDFGILGPQSMAEQTQTWWHGLGGWALPLGWRNQLKSEPGFNLKFERQWKFSPTRPEDGWGFEFLPHAGVSLGTVQTFGVAGAILRAGYNIPDDFGVQNIDSLATLAGGRTSITHSVGAYIFAGVEGRAVARNAFLDGNLWHSCHHVSKEPLVGDFKAGGVLSFKHFDVALTFVERTREFKGQSRDDRFGSLSLNFKF